MNSFVNIVLTTVEPSDAKICTVTRDAILLDVTAVDANLPFVICELFNVCCFYCGICYIISCNLVVIFSPNTIYTGYEVL